MMKISEIRDLNIHEIDEKCAQSKKELFELRVQAKTGKLEKQHRIDLLKKFIARLLTAKKELQRKEK